MPLLDAVDLVVSAAFVIASVIALTWWIPQMVRIVKVGSSGVSAGTWALYAASAGVWGLWALFERSWVFGTIQSVETVGIVVVVALLRAWRLFLLLCVAVVGLLAVALAGGGLFVGVVGIVVTAASRIPQIRKAFFEPDGSGVSGRAWTIGLVGNVSWIVWSAAQQLWLFTLTCVAAVLSSLVIVVVTRMRSRRASTETTPPRTS